MDAQQAEPIGGETTGFGPSADCADANRTVASGESIGDVGVTFNQPREIGRYRILKLLGEGGMGSVYRAEQQNPSRVVALKVIRPGIATSELLRRFEQEAQALGRLQHPGIAQIYEAGTADNGFGPQPYFAMELIEGRSLTEYAQERKLNVRGRLELMAKVCDAVNHAHQRGIIHRDLKPVNILVDEEGQPKILDFGVARVTDSDAGATRQTDVGQLIGTLAYMSPEQVVADPLELDARSDVYALGVILYELLAGRLPYDLRLKLLHEVVQVIREADPVRLSSIDRSYRGDIETIVGKALEKDKARRYVSAAELATDIRRYLTHEPIVARPASTSYQLQKFARRNRALVAGTAAVFLVLAIGVVVSTWQAVRARRAERTAVEQRDHASMLEHLARAAQQSTREERDRAVAAEAHAQQERNVALTQRERADSEAANAKAVNDFLQNDLLAQASAANQSTPTTKPDPDLKVRTALDRAAAQINGKFDRQPLVEAAIRDTIGQTYQDLGLYPESRKQLEIALALQRRVGGPEDPKALDIARRLGVTAFYQGKYVEAARLESQTLEIDRKVLGPDHTDTLKSMKNLANVYRAQGKMAQAEALQSQAFQAMRRVLGPEDPNTLKSMTSLALIYMDLGKYTKAEALQTEALEIDRKVLGAEHPSTLQCMQSLGAVYLFEAKYAQAEALYNQVSEIERRVLGPEHPSTLLSLNNLADAYSNQGDYLQAEVLYRQLLEIDRRISGPENPKSLISMDGLADTYNSEGNYPQAEALDNQILEISRRVLGPEHPRTLSYMKNLAVVYSNQGKYAQAEALFNENLEIRRRVIGPEHPLTLRCVSLLAYTYSADGKYAQAEALLTENLEVERRVLGPDNRDTLRTLSDMASLYQLQAKYGLAEAYAARALAGRRHLVGSDHPDTMAAAADLALANQSQGKFTESELLAREIEATERAKRPDIWLRFWAESLVGASLAGEKKYADAEPLLLDGYRGMMARKDRISAPNWRHLKTAHEWILQLYAAWDKPEKAAQWRVMGNNVDNGLRK
jgi:eukaryotic-like serine/threonine-protein kinase